MVNRRSASWAVRILLAVTTVVGCGWSASAATGATAPHVLTVSSPTSVTASGMRTATDTPVGTDLPVDTANPFLPDDRDLTDCVGLVERPGCGSESRGGLHQNLVAIAMIAGLLIVFGRVAWVVRRGQKRQKSSMPS